MEYLNDKASYNEKIKNEFEWVKKRVQMFDRYNHIDFFSERAEKFRINYDLYNGRMDFNTYVKTAENYAAMDIVPEINTDNEEYIHFPIIQQILNDLEGEEIKRPFKLMVVSTNTNAESSRSQKRKELLTNFVVNKVKTALLEELKIKEQGYLESRLAQISGLESDQYYQAYSQIVQEHEQKLAQQVEELTPTEIENYMTKGFKLPEEQTADEILQYHIRTDRLKHIFDKGWKDVIITGEEIYRPMVLNGKPVLKVINPVYFNYSKGRDVEFIDEVDWCSYTEYKSVYDILNEFKLDKDEINRIYDQHQILDVPHWDMLAAMQIQPLNTEPSQEASLINISQRRIRVTHFVFKTSKKVKKIVRIDPETGNEKEYLSDETYKFDELSDISQEEFWIPEYWECTKICTADPIYKNIGPLEHQFRNPDNPYDIRNCYTGLIYSARNSKAISICDLGKPWQFIYNMVLNQIIELFKSDIGRIMLGNIGQIPKDYNPLKWMEMIKKYKVALIDTSREGVNSGTDPQYWKTIDLTHAQEISQKIELLEYIERKIAQSMSYNPSRLGMQSPYETASANQSNIAQSFNQTEKWFYLHQLVKERVTENFLEICKQAYKDNPLIASYVLSDMSIATLNTEYSDFYNHYFKVYVSNSSRDTEMLNNLKNMIQPIIQNSNGDMRVAAEILTAETATEIKNIIHRVEEQRQAIQQAASAQEQKMKEMELFRVKEIEDLKHAYSLEEIKKKGEIDIQVAEIQAERFAKAKDINENNINDDIEKEKLKMKLEHEKNKSELEKTLLKDEIKRTKNNNKK